MSNLKRIPIKYVRDRAKSRYIKDPTCKICGVDGSLDFHHYLTVDILFDNWLAKEGLTISSAEEVMDVRDTFINSHEYEMFTYAVTLCRDCHKRLHGIYGQRPSLTTAPKQERWVEIQRLKRI